MLVLGGRRGKGNLHPEAVPDVLCPHVALLGDDGAGEAEEAVLHEGVDLLLGEGLRFLVLQELGDGWRRHGVRLYALVQWLMMLRTTWSAAAREVPCKPDFRNLLAAEMLSR
jgi:hypothetical protein